MSRFKILVFLLAVSLLGSILAGAYWVYTRVLGHDAMVETQIQHLQSKRQELPDPGIRRFDKAIEQVKSGDLAGGKEALYELVWTFPDSSRAPEARRIIGEINMDELYSVERNPTRRDYIVQPGDSLERIARRNQTTIECVMRANGMLSTGLQPGDHLLVFPLDFELVVDISAKTLTLHRGQRFFKEYQAIEIRLPPGLKAPNENLMIQEKAALAAGRRVPPTDMAFIEADKWLVANKPGLVIRAFPEAKPVAPAPPPAPVAENPKQGSRRRQQGGAKAAAESAVPEAAPAPETGVFLAREDAEELYTIIRSQTPLKLRR